MASNAMVVTAIRTAHNIVKMNQAARFAAFGEGCVMPIVLMNAFEMKRSSFTFYLMNRQGRW